MIHDHECPCHDTMDANCPTCADNFTRGYEVGEALARKIDERHAHRIERPRATLKPILESTT